MLSHEVVDAVRKRQFHIWTVKNIDEGIELLTGMPAGERAQDGTYPENSVHGRAIAWGVRGENAWERGAGLYIIHPNYQKRKSVLKAAFRPFFYGPRVFARYEIWRASRGVYGQIKQAPFCAVILSRCTYFQRHGQGWPLVFRKTRHRGYLAFS